MSKLSEETASRQLTVQQHTNRLREILQGALATKVTATTPKPPTVSRQPTVNLAVAESTPPPTPPTEEARTVTRPATAGSRQLMVMEQCLRRPRSRVAQLVAKTQRLAQFNQILQAFLPPHLQEHATLAKLDAKDWVVQTDSSAWATRLRYVLPNLRPQLEKQLGISIPPPRIRIAPPAIPAPAQPPPRRLTVTNATVNMLETTADNLADEGLGAAMRRLAEHAKQRRRES